MMNVLTEADQPRYQRRPRRGIDYLANLKKGCQGLKIAYSPIPWLR